MKKTILVWMSCTFSSLTVFAHSNSPATVPKGVFRLQVTGVTTSSVENGFSENGESQSLAHDLNRSISVKDFAKSDPRVQSLVSALEALSPGISDQLFSSNLFGDIEVSQKRFYTGLSYGLNKKTTLSVAIPVIKRSISTSLNADSVNNSAVVQQDVGNLSPTLTEGLNTLANEVLDGEFYKDKIFREKGYIFESKKNETSIGDVELKSRYSYLKKKRHAHAVDVSLILPTGKAPAIDNIFDPGSGKGKWSLKVENRDHWFIDRRRNHAINLRTGVLFSLADQRERAIPKDEDDSLPSLLEEDGQVQLSTETSAPRFIASVGMENQFFGRRMIVDSEVTYEQQGQSKFEGPGDLFYEGLEEGTNETKLSTELGIGYSSVQQYLRTRKGIPFRAFVRFHKTLSGKNTEDVSYIRTDFVLFFK